MSKKTGGQAFPSDEGPNKFEGMTLRDYFAIHADACDVEDYRNKNPRNGEYSLTITEARYSFADAMIAEREKQ